MAADVFDSCLFCVCILTIFICSVAEERPELFTENGDVFILDHQNFNKSIHDSNCVWVVNFYNSWCGHCVKFAPLWSTLATSVKRWDKVIRLAAIDCSVTENLVPCREHNIQGFPTLLTFPAHSAPTFLGITYNDSYTEAELYDHILYVLSEDVTNHQSKNQYSSLLHPLNSLEEIWRHVDPAVQYVAVLFEEEGSYTGQELILDMLPHRELVLRRMLKKDVTQFGVKVFPSLYLIQKDGSFQNLVSKGWDREHFRSALRQLLNLPSDVARPIHRLNDQMQEKQIPTESTDAVYMDDLLSAVSYSLMHEIPSMKIIDDLALQVLKDYIIVLCKYLPVPEVHKNYLWKLNNWLHHVRSIDGASWLKKMHNLQDSSSYIPSETNYTGCRGSEPRFRGYPCSMWVMFHTLTVNSVLEGATDVTFDSQEVLLAMRGYIIHFFGCKECRVNFKKEIKLVQEQVHEPDDAILYLWEAHNRVNFRLHGDLTEDPKHSKVQFPSKTMCVECYLDGPGRDDGRPNWDQRSVLNYLKELYSRDHIVASENFQSIVDTQDVMKHGGKISELENWRRNDAKRREDLSKLSNIKSEKSKSTYSVFQDGRETKYDRHKIEKLKRVELDTRITDKALVGAVFSDIDLSLCVVFYLLCTVGILVVYYHFIVRRGMKPRICCQNLV